MASPKSIAIVGCGTGGLAAAAYLQRDGHLVHLFEAFGAPKPLGAGLMLQPTGLACLANLGLDEKAITQGAIINGLYGTTLSERTIFDLTYRDLRPHYFAVGIHRGTLFQILYDAVTALQVPITTHCHIARTSLQSGKRFLRDDQGTEYGPFDLVIDASGRNSPLREQPNIKLNKPYPYGVIWGVVADPGQAFGQDHLQQRYDGASTMVGMLPIGYAPNSRQELCALFWSLPPGGYEAWLETPLEQWRDTVTHHWPALAPFVNQFTSHNDLTFATYSDIILKQWHSERMAYIGDAGHNTSPQLGQGANMALVDAITLARALGAHDDMGAALAAYSVQRKAHLRFNQMASRALTPFFQSDSWLAGQVRDLSFGTMCKTPYLKQQMLSTLTSVKTGLFTRLNPGDWHPKYDWRG